LSEILFATVILTKTEALVSALFTRIFRAEVFKKISLGRQCLLAFPSS